MATDALLYQIALPLLPEVGLRRARHLVQHFGSAEALFRADRKDIAASGILPASATEALVDAREGALKRAEEELHFVDKHDLRTWWYEDEDYPELLRELPDAPLLLYSKGDIRMGKHTLSIVGTREPSDRGKQLCHDLIIDLAAKVPDLTIISGLAYGVDICAHRAALEADIPTIGIPAHGLDRIYPAAHRNTAVEMLRKGGILTEYMSGTNPDKPNFVARNRIVAGLAEATVVVESKVKGGSLITARVAADYGRTVFAFPGRPTDEIASGCNDLIRRRQAQLISSADDIISAMGWEAQQPKQTSLQEALFAELSEAEARVMEILRRHEDGIHINSLSEEAGIPYSEVSSMLFGLEMNGLVRSLPGSRYRAS